MSPDLSLDFVAAGTGTLADLATGSSSTERDTDFSCVEDACSVTVGELDFGNALAPSAEDADAFVELGAGPSEIGFCASVEAAIAGADGVELVRAPPKLNGKRCK